MREFFKIIVYYIDYFIYFFVSIILTKKDYNIYGDIKISLFWIILITEILNN